MSGGGVEDGLVNLNCPVGSAKGGDEQKDQVRLGLRSLQLEIGGRGATERAAQSLFQLKAQPVWHSHWHAFALFVASPPCGETCPDPAFQACSLIV